MAKTALVQKQQRKPKFKVRGYTRCKRCGRALLHALGLPLQGESAVTAEAS